MSSESPGQAEMLRLEKWSWAVRAVLTAARATHHSGEVVCTDKRLHDALEIVENIDDFEFRVPGAGGSEKVLPRATGMPA